MATNQNIPNLNWPQDSEGNPMSLVSYSYHELIPIAKFANCQVGPVTIHKFVSDGAEEDGIMEAVETCESIVQKQREEVLKELEAGNS